MFLDAVPKPKRGVSLPLPPRLVRNCDRGKSRGSAVEHPACRMCYGLLRGGVMLDQAEPGGSLIHLKEEFAKLSEEQLRALRAATYVGMMTQEAKTYDDRRRRITEVARRLSVLLRLQENQRAGLELSRGRSAAAPE